MAGLESSTEKQLRLNVKELMKIWRLNQATLAAKLGKGQPWLSRRLSEKDAKTRFQLEDIDALCAVFQLTPSELLRPGYGKWDRRSGRDRRSGAERRGIEDVESDPVTTTTVHALRKAH